MVTLPDQSLTTTVAIGVPVFNGAEFLEDALRSIQRQTFVPASVLVWDNASTDDSAEIAVRILGVHSVRRSSVNMGAAASFNRLVGETSSDFFMWLAADDLLEPTMVQRCLNELSRHPARAAALPGIRYVDGKGQELRISADPDLASSETRTRLRSYLRRRRWTETYCLFRRDELLRSPMFTGEFGSDVLLMWWFVLRGPLAVLDEPLLNYREYPKSVEDAARAIDPGAPRRHWRKCRLWAALWRHTRSGEIDRATARVARQELLLWPMTSTGLGHLFEDLLEVSISVTSRNPVTERLWAGFLDHLRALRRPQG